MKISAALVARASLGFAFILLAAVLFSLGCEALQFGPFGATGPAAAQPAYQTGFSMLLGCFALLCVVFKRFVD